MSGPGSAIAAACAEHGLDLSTSLQVGWYNARVAAAHRLPDFDDERNEVVLIGNTRALWPRFVAALERDPALLADDHPLDRYVESAVDRALAAVTLPTRVRWAHRPDPAHVSFQTLAEVAGLAWRSPASLSVHPVYGPWIALRAAVVLPMPGPVERPPSARVCDHCASGCEPALARLMSLSQPSWRDWLAIREACPLGRDHRYSALQTRYHYTKSRRLLVEAVAGGASPRG